MHGAITALSIDDPGTCGSERMGAGRCRTGPGQTLERLATCRDAHSTQAYFACSVPSRVAGQASAVSKAVMLRLARLNSTPTKWIGSPAARYLSA